MRSVIKAKIEASSDDQIDLGRMEIKDPELTEIIQEILQQRPNLKILYLNHNKISDIGAVLIGEKLVLPKLTFIDLQFNNIDKKGITAILALKKIQPRIVIALSNNRISNITELQQIEREVFK